MVKPEDSQLTPATQDADPSVEDEEATAIKPKSTRLIFVPMYNFWSVSSEDITQPLRMLSVLSTMVFGGLLGRFSVTLPKVKPESGVLLASSLLKHYAYSPCWDLTEYVRINAAYTYNLLGRPRRVSAKGHAIELEYEGWAPQLSLEHDLPLKRLARTTRKLILGKRLRSEAPITMLIKVIVCPDNAAANAFGQKLNLAKIADGLFVGPCSSRQQRMWADVFWFVEKEWETVNLLASPIVTAPHKPYDNPAYYALRYAILVSLYIAELHSIWDRIPDVVFQLHLANIMMPLLFRAYLEKNSLVKYWLRFDDTSITQLSAVLAESAETLLVEPGGYIDEITWKIHGDSAFKRFHDLCSNLDHFIDLFSSLLTNKAELRRLPLTRSLASIKKLKPREQIHTQLSILREQLNRFSESFEKHQSEVISLARMQLAVRGIVVAVLAMLITLGVTLLGMLSTEIHGILFTITISVFLAGLVGSVVLCFARRAIVFLDQLWGIRRRLGRRRYRH